MKGKILIVDDEPDFYQVLVLELKARDYKTTSVSSIDAVKGLNDIREYGLIIVDLYFQRKLLGFDFIKWLRSKNVTASLIIVTYEKEQKLAIEAFRNYNVNDFLLKQNFDIAEWLEKVEKFYSSHKKNRKKVIISYSNEDEKFALLLKDELLAFPIEVILPKEYIEKGKKIDQELKNIYDTANSVIVFISKSTPSKWQKKEIDLLEKKISLNTDFPVLPIIFDEYHIFGFLENIEYLKWEKNELGKVYFEIINFLLNEGSKKELLKGENSYADIGKDIKNYTREQRLKAWRRLRYLRHLEGKEVSDIEEEIEKLEKENSNHTNLISAINLIELNSPNCFFFNDLQWKLNNNVNILLGKNGYGKTLLLRILSILASKNREVSEMLFKPRNDIGHLTVKLQAKVGEYGKNWKIQDTSTMQIKWDGNFLGNTFGKIPILAIGANRFFPSNFKSQMDKEFSSIRDEGADLFIRRQPEHGRVNDLIDFLREAYKSYNASKKAFDLSNLKESISEKVSRKLILNEFIPEFKFIKEIIGTLINDEFTFEYIIDDINRPGHFNIFVKTGYDTEIIDLSLLSAGTHSIFYVFGLIYQYLKALHVYRKDYGYEHEQIEFEHGIVIIDEIDAHLHLDWQQDIISLLRNTFPNVQFILSAHSPLIISGCYENEVAVLRKGDKKEGFYIQPFENHFIGWKVSELLGTVYHIEEMDETYIDLYCKELLDIEKEIRNLEQNANKSEEEEIKLKKLKRDIFYHPKVID